MSKLIMLEGIPASGKSTLAIKLRDKFEGVIHSSDELRKELYGSYNTLDKNTEIFKELHFRIENDLRDGRVVIYDATNLSRKRRALFLSELNIDCEKEIIVVATEFSVCLDRDSKRDKKVGANVIKRMIKRFEFPLESEGWDSIKLHYTHDIDFKKVRGWFNETVDFDQENPNHSLSLDKHMDKAMNLYLESCDTWINYEIYMALTFHDIGKLWTKTFYNKKGIKSDTAHYYDHQNVSAYQCMFLYTLEGYDSLYEGDYTYILRLINYHMHPYSIESEKSKKKWKNIFGEALYDDLMVMNKFDRLAH